MAIKKEYRCLSCGSFEATEPVCPNGCTTVVTREFRTAPGYLGARSKSADATLQRLADSYGLSDINNRDGRPAAQGQSRSQPQAPQAQWLPMPKSDKESGRDVITETLSGLGVDTRKHEGEVSFSDIAKGLGKPRAEVRGQAYKAEDLARAVKSI